MNHVLSVKIMRYVFSIYQRERECLSDVGLRVGDFSLSHVLTLSLSRLEWAASPGLQGPRRPSGRMGPHTIASATSCTACATATAIKEGWGRSGEVGRGRDLENTMGGLPGVEGPLTPVSANGAHTVIPVIS